MQISKVINVGVAAIGFSGAAKAAVAGDRFERRGSCSTSNGCVPFTINNQGCTTVALAPRSGGVFTFAGSQFTINVQKGDRISLSATSPAGYNAPVWTGTDSSSNPTTARANQGTTVSVLCAPPPTVQTNMPNGIGTCTGNVCSITQCNAGFADCDAQYADGCEINLNVDPANCGGCGTVCPSGVCSSGVCS